MLLRRQQPHFWILRIHQLHGEPPSLFIKEKVFFPLAPFSSNQLFWIQIKSPMIHFHWGSALSILLSSNLFYSGSFRKGHKTACCEKVIYKIALDCIANCTIGTRPADDEAVDPASERTDSTSEVVLKVSSLLLPSEIPFLFTMGVWFSGNAGVI